MLDKFEQTASAGAGQPLEPARSGKPVGPGTTVRPLWQNACGDDAGDDVPALNLPEDSECGSYRSLTMTWTWKSR